MLDITISDNGAGMTEEMIEKVMSGSASQDNEDRFSTGIAVRNVIDRLQLYYKQKEFFTIESDGPDTGTTVHIMIPVEKDDTFLSKCTGYDIFECFQHNSLIICYQDSIHTLISPFAYLLLSDFYSPSFGISVSSFSTGIII